MPNNIKNKQALLIIIGIIFLIGCFVFLKKFVFDTRIDLKTEVKTGNINVVLLGKGGANHEGPDLTDTIIVATINPEKGLVNLISIPRDLWVPDLQDKINTAYAYGQERDKQGKLLAKTSIAKITGKKIDYVFVIDFSGFVKLVDHLGGIDVIVENTLDDYQYPVEGKEDDNCGKTDEEIVDLSEQVASGAAIENEAFACRYKHIHFDKGVKHMNGKQALEFVRSRHGLRGEGSDFARSQRQQNVINAIKNRSLSLGVLLNPIKVLGALNIIKENIDMNAKASEVDDFINLAKKMQNAQIKSSVIDIGSDAEERNGLLIHPPISEEQKYKWVLIPRVGDGNFSEIQTYITCVENGNVCQVARSGIVIEAKKSR